MISSSECEGGLVIAWKYGRYYNDVFPIGFFLKAVKNKKREHGIKFENKISVAKCRLTIKENMAILEYADGANGHDLDIESGQMTIHFKDKSRKIVSRVDFIDSKGRYGEDLAKTNWDDVAAVLEGKRGLAEVRYFSRNQNLMESKKAQQNYCCEACGYRLEVNGIFIVDCHHKKPVAMDEERKTGPEDLLVLCPNCHRIAHTSEKPLSLIAIKRILKKAGIRALAGD